MQILGINPETGKKIVRPVYFWSHLNEHKDNPDIIKVPCGKCIGCRLDRANEWSERIMLEASNYSDNCFLTLTYSNENLPPEIIEESSGLIYNPLVKRDLQLFIKRLRKKYNYKKIRFFAVGEFGSVSNRPHYHVILFNHKFEDLKPLFFNNQTREWCYTSESLSSLWKKGLSSIGTLTKASAGYVARYSVKNQFFDKKEFLLMSRNPGIGKDFFEKFKRDIYLTDKIYYNFSNKKKMTKPFRYFDKLLENQNLELFNEIKENRKLRSAHIENNKLVYNNTEFAEVVNNKNDSKNHKILEQLKRRL